MELVHHGDNGKVSLTSIRKDEGGGYRLTISPYHKEAKSKRFSHLSAAKRHFKQMIVKMQKSWKNRIERLNQRRH